jgi:hypothetical protein
LHLRLNENLHSGIVATERIHRAASVSAVEAYSSPVYISVGPAPTLVRDDIALMIRWIDRLWALLEERNNFGPTPNREQAGKLFDQARRHYELKLTQAAF